MRGRLIEAKHKGKENVEVDYNSKCGVSQGFKYWAGLKRGGLRNLYVI